MSTIAQTALTVVAPISPEKVEPLRDYLNQIGRDIDGIKPVGGNRNPDGTKILDFTQLTTTHFLKWVILPETDDFPPQIAFEGNFDGDTDIYLAHLWNTIPGPLERIYSSCCGRPRKWDQASFLSYMKQYALPVGAFYIGLRGESVPVTHADRDLRMNLQAELDTLLTTSKTSLAPAAVFQQLKQIASTKYAAFLRPASPPLESVPLMGLPAYLLKKRWWYFVIPAVLILALVGLGFYAGGWTGGILSGSTIILLLLIFVAILVLALCVLAVGAGLIYKTFRELETRDAAAWKFPAAVTGKIPEHEDWEVQNPMTHIVKIKSGLLRICALKAVLWAVHQLAIITFNQGNLGGIPTIHFGRWVIIDSNRRLLFFSNYDGSWESYLGDFILRSSVGLTGIWSNTEDYPPTNNLVLEGSRHADAFKEWTRQHQVPTQIWYSAYPNSSINNRVKGRSIRNFLYQKNPKDDDIAAWLKLF